MGAGGIKPPTAVNFVASGSGTGTTVTYPATVVAGDVLLVSIYTYANGSATGPATPSGWTQIGFAAAAPWNGSPAYRVMGALYYKIATGSEGASTAGFTFSADLGGGGYAVGMYRPTFSTASVTVGDVYTSNSNAAKTITSGSATGYKGVVSCFAWATSQSSVFCSMSPTATLNRQVVSGNNTGQLLGVAFGSGAAANATVTQGTGSFGYAVVSCYLSLS